MRFFFRRLLITTAASINTAWPNIPRGPTSAILAQEGWTPETSGIAGQGFWVFADVQVTIPVFRHGGNTANAGTEDFQVDGYQTTRVALYICRLEGTLPPQIDSG